MSKKPNKDKLRADIKRARQGKRSPPPFAALGVNQRNALGMMVKNLLDKLTVPGTRLEAALIEYNIIKNAPAREGLCHNIATAIILDLADLNLADGWRWRRGTVDGGILHSWVEYRGLGVDMSDKDKLHIWPVYAPKFKRDGNSESRNSEQTREWVAQQDKILEILALLDGRSIIVSDKERVSMKACADSSTIDRWLRNAAAAESAQALMADRAAETLLTAGENGLPTAL